MPTVENTGTYIKRYNFWNPATWTIPSLYWDTFSQEQRIHAICRQLSKVIQYADYLGVNTDDIAARLKAIEDGQLDEFIVAAIEEWFEENQPAIVSALAALNDALPINDYDSANTVSDRFANIENLIPITDFNENDTVADALNDIASLLPSSAFSDVNTVDTRFDVIEADSWVTTDRIADSNVTTAKIADSNVTTAKIADANVTTAKIADDAITTAKIADANVTTAKIADGAITTDKIADHSITRAKLVEDSIFLIFGDSWCNFADHPDWATDVNKVLKCDTVLNYGVGGAGFTVGGNLISSQVTSADNALTAAQKANVKYICVMAGINDCTPYPAANMATAFDGTMQQIKNTFPNALIEWYPTTCEPSCGNTTAPKWLYSIASFWYLVGRYFAGSDIGDESNRFCAPSCGPMFYFNLFTSSIATFFDDSKLHLNEYGKHAIVNAVLDGFGLGNEPFFISTAIARGDHYVNISATPNNITIRGAYNNSDTNNLGAFGERLLGVMAAEQAYTMFVNGHDPDQYTLISTAAADTTSYLNLEPINSFTGLQLGTASSYSSGTYFIS